MATWTSGLLSIYDDYEALSTRSDLELRHRVRQCVSERLEDEIWRTFFEKRPSLIQMTDCLLLAH